MIFKPFHIAAIAILALSLSQQSNPCFGGSFTINDINEFSGGVRLIDGQLCFSDASCMSTAYLQAGEVLWGQIQGAINDQIDLSTKFLQYQNLSAKGQPHGYPSLDSGSRLEPSQIPQIHMEGSIAVPVTGSTPTWHTQGLTWVELPEFKQGVYVYDAHMQLTVSYSDNIGIQGAVWCNVGIFLDAETTPRCFGSWSGYPYGATFSQQSLTCPLGYLSAGRHEISVKHRSQNCVYGNYWSDEFSTQRRLTFSEFH